MGIDSTYLRSGLSALLDVAFPPICAVCGLGVRDASEFCQGCQEDLLVFDRSVCRRCSTPVLAEPPHELPDCAACRNERWAFDQVLAIGPYEGLLRRLVLDAKRSAGEPAARGLGKLLVTRLDERLAGIELVIPTPQHWTRRLSRRADGVAALAQALAQQADLPIRKSLRRRRATPHQTSVAPSDRAANVRGAFGVARPSRVAGLTIALVDDVFTTGSTCHAAARALKQAGAHRVVAVVAARRLGAW